MEQQSISVATVAMSAGSAIVVSTATSAIAVWLAMVRFRADKWWERKHDSYTKLLRTLHQLVRYAATHLDEELGERTLSKDEKKQLEEDWRMHFRAYLEAKDLADFDLSDGAVQALNEYEIARREAEDDEDVVEWMKNDLKASEQCLAAIKSAAHHDLRIRRRPAFWRKNS